MTRSPRLAASASAPEGALPTAAAAAAADGSSAPPRRKKLRMLAVLPSGMMYTLLNVAFHVSALVSVRSERTT
jgi:hypothetical protein